MNNQKSIDLEEFYCSNCGASVKVDNSICPKCGVDFDQCEEIENKKIRNGRYLVLAIFIITLGYSLAGITGNFISYGTSKLFIDTIRIGLTLILFYNIYVGVNGARIIAIILYVIAGIIALIAGFKFDIISLSTLGIMSTLLGLFYFESALILARSESIKIFQEFQREKNVA